MAESGKKRKRDAGGAAGSKKKVVIEAPSLVPNAKVKVVSEGDKRAPIIASVPGLAVPSSLKLHPYTKRRDNAPQKAGRNGALATTEMLLHSSDHPKLDYTVREEEAGGTDALLNHYVGVFDPETGKLELIQARNMVLRGIVRAQQAPVEAMLENEDHNNMRTLRNDLGQTFGTKKAKKAIASLTENAISGPRDPKAKPKIDAAAAAMLDTMASTTADMATRAQLQMAADESKPRPRANLEATNIQEVYTIEELVGIEILKNVQVKEWQDAAREKRDVAVKSAYVANRLQRFASDTDNVQKTKLLRFLLALIDFYNVCKPARSSRRVPDRSELREAMNCQDSVIESIRRKFSTSSMMSKFQIDLLFTHVCVIALMIENYEVDMYDLLTDLKLDLKQMSQYFQEVGAKIGAAPAKVVSQNGWSKSLAAQHRYAKLKLPLEFPKVAFARKAR